MDTLCLCVDVLGIRVPETQTSIWKIDGSIFPVRVYSTRTELTRVSLVSQNLTASRNPLG